MPLPDLAKMFDGSLSPLVSLALFLVAALSLFLPLWAISRLGKVVSRLDVAIEQLKLTQIALSKGVEQTQEINENIEFLVSQTETITSETQRAAVSVFNLDAEAQHTNQLLEWIGNQGDAAARR